MWQINNGLEYTDQNNEIKRVFKIKITLYLTINKGVKKNY